MSKIISPTLTLAKGLVFDFNRRIPKHIRFRGIQGDGFLRRTFTIFRRLRLTVDEIA